jgi:transcription-repair coupling factor (superfamily II helicase)
LGTGQTGHIAAVGYDLYCQMVTEAVAELKGEPVREPAEMKLDLPVDAHLPEAYVAREELRLEAYRRLAAVETAAEVADIRAEWEDRYGPVPEESEALLAVARLRAECLRVGVRDLSVTESAGFGGPPLVARVRPLELLESRQIRLARLHPKAVYKEATGELQIPLQQGDEAAEVLIDLLTDLVPPEDVAAA